MRVHCVDICKPIFWEMMMRMRLSRSLFFLLKCWAKSWGCLFRTYVYFHVAVSKLPKRKKKNGPLKATTYLLFPAKPYVKRSRESTMLSSPRRSPWCHYEIFSGCIFSYVWCHKTLRTIMVHPTKISSLLQGEKSIPVILLARAGWRHVKVEFKIAIIEHLTWMNKFSFSRPFEWNVLYPLWGNFRPQYAIYL